MQGRVPAVFVATEPDDWDRIRRFPDQNQPINTATWNKSVVLQKRFIQAVVLRACRLASTPSDMMPSADETNVHWGVLLLLLKDNDHMNCDWLIFVFFMILISLERFPETCWQFGFIFLTLVREFPHARILSDITGTVVPRVDATDAPDRETSQFSVLVSTLDSKDGCVLSTVSELTPHDESLSTFVCSWITSSSRDDVPTEVPLRPADVPAASVLWNTPHISSRIKVSSSVYAED